MIRFFLTLLMLPLFAFGQTRRISTFKTDNLGGPSRMLSGSNVLFFSAWDSIHGRELWTTDGTAQGTAMVLDIYPGLNSGIDISFEYNSLVVNNILYFRASNGVNGFELWRSDGTAAGTYLLKELGQGPADGIFGNLTAVGNAFYFTAGVGQTLYKSDGTAAGTVSIRSFTMISNLYGFNNVLYFAADAANNGQELWRSNGTLQGTYLLKDLNGVTGASLPCNFHAAGNKLFFMASTNDGWELWRTNGTPVGTYQVKDINPGGANSVMNAYGTAYMNHKDDTLFFRANDGVNGYQLWKSDGTASGTLRLSNINNGVDPYATFPVVNNKVLFNSYNVNFFYQYDPANGTVSLSNYPSYTYFNGYAGKYLFDGSQMYFAGRDSVYGSEMILSDGSPGGITLLQETHLTNNWSNSGIQGFNTICGNVNGQLVFSQSRTAFTTEVPLFSYSLNVSVACHRPEVLVATPRSNTEMHLIWNRVGASEYRLRYKEVNAANWTVKQVFGSYLTLKNLTAAASYQYQVRAVCNGVFSAWSDTAVFMAGINSTDYILTILADRPGHSNAHRIFWHKTQQVTSSRIRYRVAGTLNWTVAGNSDGAFRIQNLQPETLYEYQYKGLINGSWDVWSFSTLYFKTGEGFLRESEMDTLPESNKVSDWFIAPNPVMDAVHVIGENLFGNYQVSDLSGRVFLTGDLEDAINVSSLNAGIYLLQINNVAKRFVKL